MRLKLLGILGLAFALKGCGDSSHNVPRCITFGEDCKKRTLEVYETIIIEAGEKGEPGMDGIDGLNGQDGLDGLAGQDGSSCSVVPTSTGAEISCTDGSFAEILHGIDGLNGQD